MIGITLAVDIFCYICLFSVFSRGIAQVSGGERVRRCQQHHIPVGGGQEGYSAGGGAALGRVRSGKVRGEIVSIAGLDGHVDPFLTILVV